MTAVEAEWSATEQALRPVLADLERQHPGLVRIDPSPDHPDISCWILAADGTGTGVWSSDAVTGADAVVLLADQVQEVVCEALWSVGKPASWPVCPDHPVNHPLDPAVVGDVATWRCPKNGRGVAPIGRL
jgi:hypothetical protein